MRTWAEFSVTSRLYLHPQKATCNVAWKILDVRAMTLHRKRSRRYQQFCKRIKRLLLITKNRKTQLAAECALLPIANCRCCFAFTDAIVDDKNRWRCFGDVYSRTNNRYPWRQFLGSINLLILESLKDNRHVILLSCGNLIWNSISFFLSFDSRYILMRITGS